MKRVLVGVDRSPAARNALAWAAELAAAACAELVVAHVIDRCGGRSGLRQELAGWCRANAERSGRLRTMLVEGEVAPALEAVAWKHDADLLVIGEPGADGFLHPDRGRVAHHLTHHARLPVAVVPRGATRLTDQVVVGGDGAASSAAALETAAQLGAALRVAVTVVNAAGSPAGRLAVSTGGAGRAVGEAPVAVGPGERAGVSGRSIARDAGDPDSAFGRALASRIGSIAVVGRAAARDGCGLPFHRVVVQLIHHAGVAVVVVPQERWSAGGALGRTVAAPAAEEVARPEPLRRGDA